MLGGHLRMLTPGPQLPSQGRIFLRGWQSECALIPMRHEDLPLPLENDLLTHGPTLLSFSVHSHHLSPLPSKATLVSGDSSRPTVCPRHMFWSDSRPLLGLQLFPPAVTVCICKAIVHFSCSLLKIVGLAPLGIADWDS